MNTLAKLSLSKDSFIYSIYQSYQARIQSDGTFRSHLIYPAFLEKTWVLPEKRDIHTFKESLNDIVKHHAQVLPHYRNEENITIENIAWFSHSIAALFADIEYMLKNYTGFGLPILFGGKIPKTNASKSIALAINKFQEFQNKSAANEIYAIFPLIDDAQVNYNESYIQEIWSLAFYYMRKSFGQYTDLFAQYVLWNYVEAPKSTEVADWNVRPPCGEEYRRQFKSLFERDFTRGNSKRNSSDKNNSDKNNKEFKNNSKFKENILQKENLVDNESSLNKENININDNLIGTNRNFKKSFDHKKPFQKPKKDLEEQDKILKIAFSDVENAILEMKKNPSLLEFELPPQNSFVRRQQHVLISEGGFETESRGENELRCVCLKRK